MKISDLQRYFLWSWCEELRSYVPAFCTWTLSEAKFRRAEWIRYNPCDIVIILPYGL